MKETISYNGIFEEKLEIRIHEKDAKVPKRVTFWMMCPKKYKKALWLVDPKFQVLISYQHQRICHFIPKLVTIFWCINWSIAQGHIFVCENEHNRTTNLVMLCLVIGYRFICSLIIYSRKNCFVLKLIHIFHRWINLLTIQTKKIWTRLTITRQHMTAKPKCSYFILFLMHSGGRFREDIDPRNLK